MCSTSRRSRHALAGDQAGARGQPDVALMLYRRDSLDAGAPAAAAY
jgi:hypothetical protein